MSRRTLGKQAHFTYVLNNCIYSGFAIQCSVSSKTKLENPSEFESHHMWHRLERSKHDCTLRDLKKISNILLFSQSHKTQKLQNKRTIQPQRKQSNIIMKQQRTLLLLLTAMTTPAARIHAMKVTNCIPVNTWTEFTEAIDSSNNGNGVLHFCPFDITHDGDENDGYDLMSDFLHLGCDKKTGTAGDAVEQINDGNRRRTGATLSTNYQRQPISSQEHTPKCIIRGTARHFNVRNKGLTMIGFDFYDSEHTAVHVSDDADMTTFLHLAFVDNIISNDQGGAMSIAPEATMTTILHCEFTSNEATDGGGAIYQHGADLTVYRSFFDSNHAVEGFLKRHSNHAVWRDLTYLAIRDLT